MTQFKKISGLLLLGSMLGVIEARSQSLVVQMKDGTETSVLLASTRSFTMPESNMIINASSGETQSLSLSQIRKIYFKDVAIFAPTTPETPVIPTIPVTGLDSEQNSENDISVYPNPASSSIYFKNIVDQSTIDIFSIDGQLVKQSVVSDTNNSVDIENLNPGLYIIRIGSKTLKCNKL